MPTERVPGAHERIVFIAAYKSSCGICEEKIEPGDEATYVDNEPCHADCARDAGEPE